MVQVPKPNNMRQNLVELATLEPRVIKDRNLLTVLYWKNYEQAKTLDDLIQCSTAESITRTFRHLIRNKEITLDFETERQLAVREDDYQLEYKRG
jgi:hypothetical protein